MTKTKFFFMPGKAALVLGGALTLTGCVGYVDGPRAGVEVESPAIVVQDDYVYYPNYDIYYSSRWHQYAYLEGGAWISRPGPPGVSVDVVLASPSERRNFRESPGKPRAGVVRQPARTSASIHTEPARKDNQKDNQHDEHQEK
jgi:hypothetical protein